MKRLFGRMRNRLEPTKIRFFGETFQITEGELPAELIIPPHPCLSITLNGVCVTGPVSVSAHDLILVEWNGRILTEAGKEYAFYCSEDGISLSATKKSLPGVRLAIREHEEYRTSLALDIIEEAYTDSFDSLEQFQTHVYEQGYTGTPILENMAYLCDEVEVLDELIILEGTRPKAGEPSHFRLVPGLSPDDPIEAEVLIATYVDETEGVSGKDVRGKPLPPPVNNFFPRFGDNIVLEDRGVVSLREGRVCFENGFIDVVVCEREERSFNWEDGFIHYKGDLHVVGDIKEGAQLKVDGNLVVEGGIFESYVFADGSITVGGNVDHSVIYGGFKRMSVRRLEEYTIQVLQVLERLLFETGFAAEDGANFEQKRIALDQAKDQMGIALRTAEPFISLVDANGGEDEKSWFATFQSLVRDSVASFRDDIGSSEVKTWMDRLRDAMENAKEAVPDGHHKVTLKSANSSHLFSSGEIIVEGTGSYLSFIESGSSVRITGLCTGTTVIADTFASIHDFNPGTQKEAKIQVKKGRGSIELTKRRANSLLILGTKEHTNLSSEEHVRYDRKSFPKGSLS